ncbi:MAG TPA: hypothetical protein VL092_03510 [Chitinophagaceae bacterium]|nr:hypothetical protein [Chitinophagaceae bacterium]
MKQLFVPLWCLLLVSTLFCGCKKDGDNQNLNNKDTKTYDFMSTKKGSWWLYKADDGSVFYRYATGQDSLVAGLTFSYYYRIDTTSTMKEQTPEYFGKNKDLYTSLIDLDGKQKDYITFIILKDNWHVGQTWDNAERKKISGFNVDMYIESEVKSVNEVLVYEGKTYDSVIHVYSELKAKLVVMPTYTRCGTLEVWFRKGTGIIREKGDIDVMSGLVKKNYGDYLIDYHIEP